MWEGYEKGDEAEIERRGDRPTAELARELPPPPIPATKSTFPVGQAVTREIQLGNLQDV